MKKYSLLPSGAGFCFGDTNKGTENEAFHTKVGGVAIIAEMYFNEAMSAKNALELLNEIMALPYFPITPREAGEDFLKNDFNALKKILLLRHVLKFMSKVQQYKTPTFVLCECGKHASIMSNKFMSMPFYSKENGRMVTEEIKDANDIDYATMLSLHNQINASSLPDKEQKAEVPRWKFN